MPNCTAVFPGGEIAPRFARRTDARMLPNTPESQRKTKMPTDIKLTQAEEALFQPGCFVALHPESKHPHAGRVGKIVSRRGSDMLVEFFADELIGKTEFCTIPLGHWGPVPECLVEEYEPRAKKRGWRVSERGMKMFRDLGWGYTAATEGKG